MPPRPLGGESGKQKDWVDWGVAKGTGKAGGLEGQRTGCDGWNGDEEQMGRWTRREVAKEG